MRWRVTIILSAVAMAASACAWAQGCGPTRLKVTETLLLDMPAPKVWALIGNFQDMSWDADAVAAAGSGGNVPEKATRTVTLKGGVVFGESLYKYDTVTMSYSYHIDRIDVTRLPVQNVSATLDVVPEEGGAKSRVRWKSVFYRYLAPGEGAPDIADANATKAMKAFLRSGLDGLRIKAESKREPKT